VGNAPDVTKIGPMIKNAMFGVLSGKVGGGPNLLGGAGRRRGAVQVEEDKIKMIFRDQYVRNDGHR
jgi:hypothetical protein